MKKIKRYSRPKLVLPVLLLVIVLVSSKSFLPDLVRYVRISRM